MSFLDFAGLSVVSRYPMEEVEFVSYRDHGDGMKVIEDGEVLVKKGVGRVRIRPLSDVIVDVFVTHTAADPSPDSGYDNGYYRRRQVRQLIQEQVTKSTAHAQILGGDFNAAPNSTKGEPYEVITSEMTCADQNISSSNVKWVPRATYGNGANTFSGVDGDDKVDAVKYDYVCYRTSDPTNVSVAAKDFRLKFLTAKVDDGGTISLSDHEAVEAVLELTRLK